MQHAAPTGGEREQVYDLRNTQPAPPQVVQHSLQTTPPEYRRRVFADGIPPRPAGLFPPGDALLRSLGADPRLHAFEKHLPGEDSPYEVLPGGGWATGNAAAARGMDLRLFYQEPAVGEQSGTIRGAVRFGDGAAIGNGYFMSAHGGSIETALDEATAELSKLEFSPLVTTREASFQLLKPVPLHRSLLITCRIREQRGIRCYVEGAILGAEEQLGSRGASSNGSVGGTGGPSGTVYATCSALLINIREWLKNSQ